MTQTLYEKYGGITLIQKLVENFHSHLMADHELTGLWTGLDWRLLVRHEVALCNYLLGGPELFTSHELILSLRRCGIGHRPFDLLSLHLMQAFESVGIHSTDRADLMRTLAGLRPEIVAAADAESLIGKGLQRSQEIMQRATQELEQATRTLTSVRNLIVNQSRLAELASSLNAVQDRLRHHPDICGMIGELGQLVLQTDEEKSAMGSQENQTSSLFTSHLTSLG